MKKLQLVLTNPCSQQWDDMQPHHAGRFCDSCAKHVVDLTAKSDAELIQFFKKKKDNVCGRLLASQLNRELLLPPVKPNWHWLLPLAFGAIIVSPAQAKQLKPSIEQTDKTFDPIPFSESSAIAVHANADTISGRVIDHKTGNPLRGVKVKQKGFENVLALTDSTGKFEMSVAKVDTAKAFTFELIGYEKVETPVTTNMVVKLPVEIRIMIGAVSSISTSREPLYIIYAGKKSCIIDAAKMSEISPDWIESVDILKDVSATAIYGSRAANGVIRVGIKKEFAKKIDFSKSKVK